jgi:signal peptide peptidase SppA
MAFHTSYWAGTEQSLHDYLLQEMRLQKEGHGFFVLPDQEEEKDAQSKGSRLLTKVGNVGVISISGSLNNFDARENRWRNGTGYPEIREALLQAAQDQEIGAIVLDVNSSGGLVAGVTDTADLIRTIDKSVKPVTAHTDGMAASAAYWLISSARSISAGPVAELGSIGVLVIHREASKMMADMGIKASVLRAGKFKALGNPYEPLTEEAKAEIQIGLDQVYTMFVSHVADRRGVSYAVADAQMAQGRMFIGDRAKGVGLVDTIANFDSVVSKAQSTVDKKNSPSQYGLKLTGSNVKNALTEQAIAALAEGAGIVAEGAGLAVDPAAGTPEAIAAKAQADAAAASAAAPAKAVADADAAVAAAAAAPSADLVNFLQTQLAAAQVQVATLTVNAAASDTKIKALEASQAGLRAIAQTSVERLSTALGLPPIASASDEALLAQHASLRGEFEKKFKAGGVAAVSSGSSDAEKAVVPSDAARTARIVATRLK